jgi:hypothetical protein
MDEDDDNDFDVDFNSLFKEPSPSPPFVQVEVFSHNNCLEMMLNAIDLFNQRLQGEAFSLSDEHGSIDRNYSLYIARKNGQPKDDFPGKFLSPRPLYQDQRQKSKLLAILPGLLLFSLSSLGLRPCGC